MERERLIQLIDACRPGSDDHQHGELAELSEVLARDEQALELFDQMQALDGRLVELFQEVPVPAGLRERLEAALATGGPVEDAAGDCDENSRLAGAVSAAVKDTFSEQPALEPASAAAETTPTALLTRRRWLAATLSGSVLAAGLLAAWMLWLEQPANLSAQRVADRADAWGAELDPADWKTNIGWIAQEFPISDSVDAQPHQWQKWQDSRVGEGVVYDLSPSTAPGSVMLYVSKSADRVDGLGVEPPSVPHVSSGNLSVAVWGENDKVYVLVIHGPGNRYEQLIERTDFALLSPPVQFRG